MNKRVITPQEVAEMANHVANQIVKDLGGHKQYRLGVPLGEPLKMYCVPKGGFAAGVALAQTDLVLLEMVYDPSEADFILDDLVDSGATRDRLTKAYPNIPFYALFVKESPEWYVFPWDNGASEAEDIFVRLLQFLGQDPTRGGLVETPKRALKAWQHWCGGYGRDPMEVMKAFEDGAEGVDEMVVVRDIPIHSLCEHHLAPIFGVAHIGYIPDGKVMGLSKFSRVADIFARRLQVQERLTNEIAESIFKGLEPKGVGVVLECRHMCMESRGVQQIGTTTVTSALRGVIKDDATARAEFLDLVRRKA